MDAAEFYTGIVPEVYSALRASRFGAGRYLDFVREHGSPALELGCGDDGPFFDLVADGVEVVGVDSSADMVRRGRERLEREGLSAPIHQQRMEDLSLEQEFAAIYLAGPTFTLLPDDTLARRALRAMARHLRPDGAALVPLWTPPPTPPEQIGRTRTSSTPAGEARYTVLAERYDLPGRTRTTSVRYELSRGDDLLRADRDWVIHWHDDEGFRNLAAQAGLDAVLSPLDEQQSEAVLRRR